MSSNSTAEAGKYSSAPLVINSTFPGEAEARIRRMLPNLN
jgi:hypothetical protein